ncbi:MAG: DUF2510 domain-containing protein [Acidimicrobiales bacterium]
MPRRYLGPSALSALSALSASAYAVSGGYPMMALVGVALMFGFFALWVVSIVYWVIALIEVVKIPDHQFKAAGSEKISWVLIVVLAGIIGALIWRFVKRDAVLAAAGMMPLPPPGWYPDPTGTTRWWDGARWTESAVGPPPSTGWPQS